MSQGSVATRLRCDDYDFIKFVSLLNVDSVQCRTACVCACVCRTVWWLTVSTLINVVCQCLAVELTVTGISSSTAAAVAAAAAVVVVML